MNDPSVSRWALLAIAVFMAPTGVQAAFAPRSFFDDFPLGRGWIAAEGGTYDEHLVRDVGVLFIALILVTVWAAWKRQAETPVAIAWVVQGVLHLAYHIGHLDAPRSGRQDCVGRVAGEHPGAGADRLLVLASEHARFDRLTVPTPARIELLTFRS